MTPHSPLRSPILRTLAAALLAAGALAVAAPGAAEARQAGSGGQQMMMPPTPSPIGKPRSTIAEMGIAVLIIAAVLGVNLIPSKRGHQD